MGAVLTWLAENAGYVALSFGVVSAAALITSWRVFHWPRGVRLSHSRRVQAAFLILVTCTIYAHRNFDTLFGEATATKLVYFDGAGREYQVLQAPDADGRPLSEAEMYALLWQLERAISRME